MASRKNRILVKKKYITKLNKGTKFGGKKLGNLRYVLKRIKSMDKKAMFDKIKSIHKKTGKSRIYLLFDMQRFSMKYGAGYMD